MLYRAFKYAVAIFFNLFNHLMFGNLPPFGSVCLVVEEQERFLVIKRPEGITVFPSGFMRWKESAEDAARREAKEETGLDLHIKRMIGYESAASKGFTHMSTLTIFFHASVVGGKLRSSIEGQPCWLDEKTLRSCLYSPYQIAWNNYLSYRDQISSHESNTFPEKRDYKTPSFFQTRE